MRSTGEAAKPDTTGQAATAKALVEALSHFGIGSKVVAMVTGPHITRYEDPARAGHEDVEGREPQG